MLIHSITRPAQPARRLSDNDSRRGRRRTGSAAAAVQTSATELSRQQNLLARPAILRALGRRAARRLRGGLPCRRRPRGAGRQRQGVHAGHASISLTLKNSHTQFFDSQLDGRPLKFRLLEVEDQWVVIGSQDSRLARGDVVRSLDGRPVNDFVRESAQYVAASNERLRARTCSPTPACFPNASPRHCRTGGPSWSIAPFPATSRRRHRFETPRGAGYATLRSPTFESRRLAIRSTNGPRSRSFDSSSAAPHLIIERPWKSAAARRRDSSSRR